MSSQSNLCNWYSLLIFVYLSNPVSLKKVKVAVCISFIINGVKKESAMHKDGNHSWSTMNMMTKTTTLNYCRWKQKQQHKKDSILASASITTVYHKKRRKYLSLELVLNKLKELKMYKAYSSKCRAKEHSIAIWIKKRFLKIFFHTWTSMKRCWRAKK